MIWFSSPFSPEKNLGKAYNDFVRIIPNNSDWVCLTDLDTQFLLPSTPVQLQQYIDKYPDTGLFTCLTNRVGTLDQCYGGVINEDPNILNHVKIARRLQSENSLEVKEHNALISGHLMMFRKDVWDRVGKFPEETGKMLGVDNRFSKRITREGYKIRIMMGVYIFHYYRLELGRFNKDHLK